MRRRLDGSPQPPREIFTRNTIWPLDVPRALCFLAFASCHARLSRSPVFRLGARGSSTTREIGAASTPPSASAPSRMCARRELVLAHGRAAESADSRSACYARTIAPAANASGLQCVCGAWICRDEVAWVIRLLGSWGADERRIDLSAVFTVVPPG